MIIFAKYGEYDRRELIELCLFKYLDTMGKTKLSDEVSEERNKNDKPYFKDYPNIRFSVSHSGDLVVVAIGETDVGVDIEEIKPRAYEKIVERNFSAGEAEGVTDLTSFLKVWTKKEAYLKLTSDGGNNGTVADVSKPLMYDGKDIKATSLDIFEGYVGAVVAEEQPIIFQQLD